MLMAITASLAYLLASSLAFGATASNAANGTAMRAPPDSGTTIVGDQDAALGLYLTPWKNESAADLDRAPGLFDHPADALGAAAFKRQIDNDDALAAYRRAHLEQNR